MIQEEIERLRAERDKLKDTAIFIAGAFEEYISFAACEGVEFDLDERSRSIICNAQNAIGIFQKRACGNVKTINWQAAAMSLYKLRPDEPEIARGYPDDVQAALSLCCHEDVKRL